MIRPRISAGWLAAGFGTLGALLLVLFVVRGVDDASAQTVVAPASISNGPGGVWVVRGNRVYICDIDPIRPPTEGPPKPRCGPPTTLR